MTATSQAARVLIVFSDTGGGHRSLTSAVAEALRERGAAVRVEDLFVEPQPGLAYYLTRLYPFLLRRLPQLYGAVFHLTDRPRLYRAIAHRLGGRSRRRAERLYAEHQPDVVLSAHALCTAALLDARPPHARPPVLALTTELVTVHASWYDPRLDGFLAATAEVEAALRRLGAPAERIRRLGLPVGARFGRVEQAPTSLRRALGLEPERFTVLLVGGGEGVGRLDRLAAALDESDLQAQLIVVCGRNAALRERIAARRFRRPVAVLGFVDTMPELLHACHVLVSKGGPQTLAEALTAGRPVLVTGVVPGQEEGNERWVERSGVGLHVPTVERLLLALSRLERDPAYLGAMTAAARSHGFGGAAGAVADWALELADRHARPSADGRGALHAP